MTAIATLVRIVRESLVVAAIAAMAVITGQGSALAAYPDKSVRIVVP